MIIIIIIWSLLLNAYCLSVHEAIELLKSIQYIIHIYIIYTFQSWRTLSEHDEMSHSSEIKRCLPSYMSTSLMWSTYSQPWLLFCFNKASRTTLPVSSQLNQLVLFIIWYVHQVVGWCATNRVCLLTKSSDQVMPHLCFHNHHSHKHTLVGWCCSLITISFFALSCLS